MSYWRAKGSSKAAVDFIDAQLAATVQVQVQERLRQARRILSGLK